MTTTAAPTPIATAYHMAERTLAILNACADLGVTPHAVHVRCTGTVDVQISAYGRDEAAIADVDTIGAAYDLSVDTSRWSANYTRVGRTTVHGVPMTLTVYTGRTE